MTAALLVGEDEERWPRLYSKGYEDNVPTDDVPERHLAQHALLLRWGSWARVRANSGGAGGSVEALYRRGGGTPPATAPAGTDPELMQVELAVLRMPAESAVMRFRWAVESGKRTRHAVRLQAPGLTLRLLYVHQWGPSTVCIALIPQLRPRAWIEHIATCRAMVQNMMRRRHG